MSSFPMTLPPSTVYGRLGIDTGPGEAIPFATLGGQLTGTETAVNDANYALVAADRTIAYTALSAARTVTLLAASAYPAGTKLYFLDRSGNASGTRSISLAPTGADLINGANTTLATVNAPYAMFVAETDGISKWAVGIPLFASSSPTLTGNWTFAPTSGVPVTITPPTGTLTNGLVINQSFGGTLAQQVAANTITVSDSAITSGNLSAAFQVQNGATATANAGQNAGLYGVATLLAATTHAWVGTGIVGFSVSAFNAGGTNPSASGTSQGQAIGGNTVGRLSSGATAFLNVSAFEFNTIVVSGATAYYKSGIQVALNSADQVRGSVYDAAVSVGSNAASGTWKYAFMVSKAHGQAALGSDSTILGTPAADGLSITHGVDFSPYTFSGKAFQSTNFSVDGLGQVVVTNLALTAGQPITWTGRSTLSSPADGNILLANNAITGFGLLQFGGTTSSFPAWKRSTTTLAARLADDSADAAITAAKFNLVTITTPAAGATLTIANNKTLTANSSLTLAGTDGKTLTVSNSGTLAGGDGFTLAIAASKTLTVSNSLTFTGTDSTSFAFPSASDTVAGLGTAQTFTKQNIFNIATTIASATAAALDDLKVAAATTTITGNTGSPITLLAKAGLYRPTLTDSSAVTVTDAATLYLDNSPLAAGSVTISNAWSLLVGAGATKLQATTINAAITYGGVTLTNAVTGTGKMVLDTAPTLTTSVTVPKVIGGSGTTGTQLTLQTTSGNGTTDELDIVGGNAGGTTFATFTAAFGLYVPITGGGLALKNSAGSAYGAVTSGGTGHYTVLTAPSGAIFFQARDTDNGASDANFGYLNNDTLQITNRANNANFAKVNSSGLTLQAGQLILSAAANFSANGSVATVLGSIGPVGSHTTVQKWLTITDGSTTLYIPAF